MELLSPGLGLIFWMSVSFGLVLLILRKYAWIPILKTIRARERAIARSLINARRIEEELQHVEDLKKEKMAEVEKRQREMLESAMDEARRILELSRENAREEARRMLGEVEKSVQAQKKAAMLEIRDQIALLSMDVAEKVLKDEMADKARSEKYLNSLLDQMILN